MEEIKAFKSFARNLHISLCVKETITEGPKELVVVQVWPNMVNTKTRPMLLKHLLLMLRGIKNCCCCSGAAQYGKKVTVSIHSKVSEKENCMRGR